MANYLKMLYAKNNKDPTPGSPTLRSSSGLVLLYFNQILRHIITTLAGLNQINNKRISRKMIFV